MTDIREKSTSLLSNTLASLSSQGSATDQASAVEAAVYEKHEGDTGNEYRDSIRQLSLNLKDNPELGTKVASGEVSASTLAQMTSEEMKSSERAAEDAEMREQGLRDARGGEGKLPVQGGEGQITADDLANEVQQGNTDASMGEEGDFKLRGQPKIQGLEGIEFNTGF